jgi:XTP/dITP diphosphohydrolase
LNPKLVLASQNAHKARELAAVLTDWDVEPLGLAMPDETGETFLENARSKARFGRAHADRNAWVAGEDSGIETDALGGRPGVRSARFAGVGATDEENVELLLAELANVRDQGRSARYVCELVALAPDGREVQARGTLEGRVADEPRGSGGFGYDPVFVPDGEERTVAQLGDAWKAENSHRARAARALAESLGGRARAL